MSETPTDTPSLRYLRRRLGRNDKPIRQNGPAIRALRKKDGWRSQTAFAEAVGISQGYLSAIELEIDGVSDSTLEAIARRLHVPVDSISRDIPEDPPQDPQQEEAGTAA